MTLIPTIKNIRRVFGCNQRQAAKAARMLRAAHLSMGADERTVALAVEGAKQQIAIGSRHRMFFSAVLTAEQLKLTDQGKEALMDRFSKSQPRPEYGWFPPLVAIGPDSIDRLRPQIPISRAEENLLVPIGPDSPDWPRLLANQPVSRVELAEALEAIARHDMLRDAPRMALEHIACRLRDGRAMGTEQPAPESERRRLDRAIVAEPIDREELQDLANRLDCQSYRCHDCPHYDRASGNCPVDQMTSGRA